MTVRESQLYKYESVFIVPHICLQVILLLFATLALALSNYFTPARQFIGLDAALLIKDFSVYSGVAFIHISGNNYVATWTLCKEYKI